MVGQLDEAFEKAQDKLQRTENELQAQTVGAEKLQRQRDEAREAKDAAEA